MATNGVGRRDVRHRPLIGRRLFLGGASATGLMVASVPASAETEDSRRQGSVDPSDVAGWVAPLEPTHAPFGMSWTDLERKANVFWTVYGVAEGGHVAPGVRFGGNCAWTEWDAMKVAWTAYRGYRAQARQTLLSLPVNGSNGVTGTQPIGYPWSWADREDWPDGSYHFDQVPRFVNATYLHYVWSRDDDFLAHALPRAELIMERYVLAVFDGGRGVWTIPDDSNDGVSGHSRPSTYMDQLRSGYQDAWVNAAAHTALVSMSRLERMAGSHDKARRYARLAATFPARYDEAFWNDETGRYAGWRDVNGDLHDAGYLHVNLEALGRGLGSPGKAHRIFELIDAPAEPVRFGPHTGSTDVYHNVVAARTATQEPPKEDWDGWSDPAAGPKPYGDNVQQGGAVMWLNYYDVMARLRYQDADRAFERFRAMLDRVASDSHLLTFDPLDRLYNDFGESLVQVGTNMPFPESGIAILPLLEGFVGVEATPDGLRVAPNLPSALLWAKVSDIDYAGRGLSVTVTRATTVAGSVDAGQPRDLAPGATVVQELEASASFNQVQAFVSATHGGWVTIALERRDGDEWTPVAGRRHEIVDPAPNWLDLAVARQGPGRYRLVVSRPGKDGPLPHPEGEGDGGMRLWAYRVVDAPQRPATSPSAPNSVITTRSRVDRFTVDLGHTVAEPVTVTLRRDVGDGWATVSTQVLVPAGRTVVVGTADQPVGRYRVIASTNDNELTGVGFTGLETAVYSVSCPEIDVTATVSAGEALTLVEPPRR
jgi:hypothetical protein